MPHNTHGIKRNAYRALVLETRRKETIRKEDNIKRGLDEVK
jgi:hypothetical protein